MTEREVVFVDGVRTAFGKMGGALRDITAEELGGIGIKGLVEKTKSPKNPGGFSDSGCGLTLFVSHQSCPLGVALCWASLRDLGQLC